MAPRNVFVFSGEGVHCPDSNITELKNSPSWLAVLDAIRDLGHEDAEGFLLSNLGNHFAPNSVVVTVAINILNADLWCIHGQAPSLAVGHSVGEIAAAYISGILSVGEAIHEAHSLGEVVAKTTGSMVHTVLTRKKMAKFPAAGLHVAAINYVIQFGWTSDEDIFSVTLCGPSSYVELYLVNDRVATKLKPEHAWHHPSLIAPKCSRSKQATKCRFVSAVTGTELFEISPDHWQLWLRQPVNFAKALEVVAAEPSIAIEMGAHPVMAGAIKATFGGNLVAQACSMRRDDPSTTVLSQRATLLENEGVCTTAADRTRPDFDSNVEKDTNADVDSAVCAAIAKLLGRDACNFPKDASLASLGVTSMLAVNLSTILGQRFGLHLPATLVFEVVDIAGLCAELEDRLNSFHSISTDAAPSAMQDMFCEDAENLPLYIEGVACALPGCSGRTCCDWFQFWQMLANASDCIVERDPSRPVVCYPNDAQALSPEHASAQGGFLDTKTVIMFDASSFGINHAEAETMDPQQRLCLRVAREAFEDSGEALGSGAAIGVFVGVTYVDFATLVKTESRSRSPCAYSGTGLTNALCSNRISYTFDLCGPSVSCDTACSSSIVTSDIAACALHRRRCTSALSVGVNVQMDPFWTSAFSMAGMLSPTGRCRFGDNGADGYVRGEGCAGLVLQAYRPEKKSANPYATLLNTYVNQDGRSNGLTAPNPASQVALIEHAHSNQAEITTSVIEAHGTGTLLGDPIEIAAMSKALRSRNFADAPTLQTGSLKTNIGHLECAAGAASTLKLALLLQAGFIPASLHLAVPNRHIDWDSCGVGIVSEMMDMASAESESLVGGVSGFGFGGTNGHVVLGALAKKPHDHPKISETPQAAVFSDGSNASVNLLNFSTSTSKARLPPRGCEPVLCWPGSSSHGLGTRVARKSMFGYAPTEKFKAGMKSQTTLCASAENIDVTSGRDSNASISTSGRGSNASITTGSTGLTSHRGSNASGDLDIRRLQDQVDGLRKKLAAKEDIIRQLEEGKGARICDDFIAASESIDFENIVRDSLRDLLPDVLPSEVDGDADLVQSGLDSLSAMELARRLTVASDVTLSATQLLQLPTVRGIAKKLHECASELNSDRTPEDDDSFVSSEVKIDGFPTSALQQGIFFQQLSDEHSQVFLETFLMEAHGPLDLTAFRASWKRVLRQIPQLRAYFGLGSDGMPVQHVASNDIVEDGDDFLQVHEKWGMGDDGIKTFIHSDRARGLKIDTAPLLRVSVLLISESLSVVVVTVHHLIIDGWSWHVVMRMLECQYVNELAGADSKNDTSTCIPSFQSVVDYESNTDATLARQHWCRLLKDSVNNFGEQSCMQADLYGSDVVRQSFCLDVAQVQALHQLACGCACTLPAILHTAWLVVYSSSSFCHRDDVVIGYTSSRRTMPLSDIEQVVGPVVNTLPLRICMKDASVLDQAIRQVHQTILANGEHEWLPFANIQDALGNRLPLDVIVDVQHSEGYSCQLGPCTTMQHKELIDSVGTPLSVRFLLRKDGTLTCTVVCETSDIVQGGVDRVAQGLQELFELMLVSAVDCSVASLRNFAALSIGEVRSVKLKNGVSHLAVPELPTFGVASPHELVYHSGSFQDDKLSLEAAFTGFAVALDQWSSGPSTFAIWSSWENSEGYRWARAEVNRSATLAANVRSPVMDCIASPDGTPAAAFCHGHELSVHQVQRNDTKVFCFHAAGSNVTQFAKLIAESHDLGNVEFTPVELPGDRVRRSESSCSDMASIVDFVISGYGHAMEAACNYILLGISFGALVAYEVSCAMAQKGNPPTQLIVVSQAAPTTVPISIDLNVDDASLVDTLAKHGWLDADIARAGAQVWKELLPAMRSDLACEQTYMRRGCNAFPCSQKTHLTILAGSEDASLMQDAEASLGPWHSLSPNVCTQIVVPRVGHGFIDTSSGRSAIRQALMLNRVGFRPVAVHALIESGKWTLVGDSGLVPRLVLDGIAETFRKILLALNDDPKRILRELSPSCSRAIPFPNPCALDQCLLHDGFQRRGMDESCAIVEVDGVGTRRSFSYKQTQELSCNVGAQLMMLGVRCLDRVALVCSKGWPQLIGAIGVLQSGASYLPIDPKQVPKDRAGALLKLADAKAIVTDAQTWDQNDWIFGACLPVVAVDCAMTMPTAMIAKLQCVRPSCSPESSAYILYTSGSTGVPKGVNCHHRGAVNTCRDLIERFGISSSDKVLALSSFSFDLSVFDLFGTAMFGGTAVVPQSHMMTPPDPLAWMKIISQESVTLINAVPAFLELIVGHCETKGIQLPSSLRLVWMSGDWVPLGLPGRIKTLAQSEVTIVSLGGATEAAIWSNMYVVPEQLPQGWKSIPYGRPLGNQTMYVLNERTDCLEHCAPWVTGMIYIGGVGVATGYLGDNERTAASFIMHPMSGERIYRTGDLGRLREGEADELLVEILGREDSQVKLNGFRIELGEVESVVLAFETIEECCASIINTGIGEVLGVFFRGGAIDIEALQCHLLHSLPTQLVPKSLIKVDDHFPLNINGKVDRKRLSEMHLGTLGLSNGRSIGVAPVGGVEILLAGAVAEVLTLCTGEICVEVNLFSIGLNSLGCMRLAAAVMRRGLQCSIRDIFTYPTVRSLANVMAKAGSIVEMTSSSETPIFQIEEAVDESCSPFPLIGITKAYWTGLWNNPYCPRGCRPQIAFEFEWSDGGRIDVERLERCFDQLVNRNAVFRAVIMRDSPSMRYLERDEVSPIKFRVQELAEQEDVEARCTEAYDEIFQDTIDPFTFPLLKGTVIHLPNGLGSRFYYCVSLFIMDGITDLTWRLHISKLYRDEELPASPALTYKAYNEGYLHEERGIVKSAKWEAAKTYWTAKIEEGLPLPPQVPLLKEAASNLGTFSDKGTATISAEQLKTLKVVAAQNNVTPTAVLLMLYGVALARHSASAKMLINVLHCLRHRVHDDSERVLGNFSSSFLCPIDVSGRRSLGRLARAVMDSLMECQMNNTISGVDVMSLMNAKKSALGKAAAPYVFVSALGLEDSLLEWKSLCLREKRVVESTSGTYMVHAIKEYPDGSMLSSFNLVDGAFDSHVSDSIVQDQLRLLEAVTTRNVWDLCPDDILGDLGVPVALGNPPRIDDSDMLHSPFLYYASCNPDAIALIDVDQSFFVSYRSLLERAMSVRAGLCECVEQDGSARYGAPLAAVVCHKSWQQIVAVLGVLLADCAYLPINVTAWPRGRIENVLDVGEVVAIVSCSMTLSSLSWLPEVQRPVINVDSRISGAGASFLPTPLPSIKCADVLAYCIFTSGSTGKPKGVAMSHKGTLNTIKALIEMHDLNAKTVTLGLSQLSFDLSVADIFLTLRVGGTLVIPSESMLSPPAPSKWSQICADYGVNLWNSVPALFGLFCEALRHEDQPMPPSLNNIWLSGDVIPEGLPMSARMLSNQSLRIYAMGGATEAGIWSNSADISEHLPTDGLVPYGNALPGQGMHVVRTEDFSIASVGVQGMLVISGSSLMMGYYNDAATTADALVNLNGERSYLTRDAGYVRRHSDGNLECMITGRIHDDCLGYVKVRGFRVELQEVEAAIRSNASVKAAVVNLFDGDIIAYIVLHYAGTGIKQFTLEQELRQSMVKTLPVYAIPKWIEILDELPLSSNGKIDRASLPAPTRAPDETSPCDGANNSSDLEKCVLAAADKVGIKVRSRVDDIFAQGADSVAALRLIFKLEEQHRVKIDIGKIFEDGRISSIAKTLELTATSIQATSVDAHLTLSKLAESPTLDCEHSHVLCFLCHGAGTTALALSSLAVEFARLTPNSRFYGVSDSFLTSVEASFGYSSIEEVANCMADLIVATLNANSSASCQGNLDIWLGGWSYGGVVAFACTRELLARGVHVKHLIMLDAPLGQRGGAELNEETQRELATSADEEIAARIAQHFEDCNDLLGKYQIHGPQLSTCVLDVRPSNSKVDYLSDDVRETLADAWYRIAIKDASHFTLVQSPVAEQIAKYCLSRIRGNLTSI